jgi:hypothetical protein
VGGEQHAQDLHLIRCNVDEPAPHPLSSPPGDFRLKLGSHLRATQVETGVETETLTNGQIKGRRIQGEPGHGPVLGFIDLALEYDIQRSGNPGMPPLPPRIGFGGGVLGGVFWRVRNPILADDAVSGGRVDGRGINPTDRTCLL